MQNMKYYYDFSGQKFGYPLSLSINSFSRQVFSRHSSLEIAYVLKGEYEVTTENFSHIIKEHELVIIAPNDIHIIRPNSREENVILTIHIDFSLFPAAMIGEIKNSYESIICTDNNNLKLLKKLKFQIGKLAGVLLRGNNNLFELNTIMMEIVYITSNHMQYPIERLPIQSIHRENYIKAIQYIDRHYQEDLRLSDVANTLMFSISYTSKLFKKYTGIPFVKYVALVRVRESIESLLEGKKSIEQIAADCGMPNSKAYTTAFKELYGIVPSNYRKKFVNNIKFNEDKREELMYLDYNQRQLLQHLLEESENIIYENNGIKIEMKEGHILCSIQKSKDIRSTITHCNDEIIIDIDKV
ncbi:MAG: helix-turn-helix domain-containing protein [Clostridium sp.]|uniref:helix-turn-helix transcriptional regulator n=1 Tax=Clostridium sp. TaxID=1506 RepID=UPI002910E0BB|nr:helix-turn-helix domain-containing protein [Clostridium sp.]MDU5108960.1 helix-turn-helix domain-containing protein [Clostridium sp.]